MGISGTLHFSLLPWIACFLRMSLTKSLFLGSRGVPYTRAADSFGEEILFTCQSRVHVCVCSASKHVSAGLGCIPTGILVGLATLLGGRWPFLCANLDVCACQRFFNNVSTGLLTFAHGKRTFLCAEHKFF